MSEALEIFNGILDQSEDWGLSQWESVIERCNWAKAYALREIREKRLYLETHFTWEAYCEEKHGLSKRHADRLIAAIPSVENLGPIGPKFSTESQIREVVSLPPARQREVWQAAVETAPEGKITASHIRSVVDNLTRGEQQVIKNLATEIRTRQTEERREERIERIQEIASASVEPLSGVGRFPIILADPPWRYDFSKDDADEIENQYPTQTIEEICAHPVASVALDDCILFMWTTSPKLEESFQVIKAWGFQYRTCAIWDKAWIGPGYYFRQRHELLLIATRGAVPVPRPTDRPDSIFVEKRTEHSKKPEITYQLIEQMYPELPKLELFARQPREGWQVWGNEASGRAVAR
jgi:N6-adenosine-specific RNA methylase IME4